MAERALHENDELVLVALMRQGNELAFQRIYHAYWERLFKYAYNWLQLRETSEEVVQDVFLTLWAKRESITVTASLSAYLYGATKHRLLNELRSSKVRNAYAADFARFVKNQTDNSNADYQALWDLQRALESKISELPKQCQAVFRLSRQEHIPNSRIAQKLNISIKTVENHLTKALKHIRAFLGEFLLIAILMHLT